MSYRIVNGKIHTVENINSFSQKNSTEKLKNTNNFNDILKKEINEKQGFNISAHAAERLRSRSISLNEQDMKTINEGINKAEEKGCRNSVILYRDLALVTSIKNRTVITAVDKNSAKDNVFTNVDSVVLL